MKATKIAFWDASALVPLCTVQSRSSLSAKYSRQFPQKVVWWSSSVEILSALMRELRDGRISSTERDRAIQRLRVLRSTWNEVLPVDYIKHLAENLLEVYTLRAADAFQLAAALKWCNEKPQRRSFVCFDNRLAESALRAGFSVAPS